MKKLFTLLILIAAVSVYAQEAAKTETPPAPKPPADAVESGTVAGDPVSLEADDQWKINGVFLQSTLEEPKYVILLPDLGKNRTYYTRFTKNLAASGIGYLAIDLRGHGKSAVPQHYTKFEREGINSQFNRMYKDVNIAVEYLKNRKIPAKNIFILGAGLGANVAASSLVFNTDIGGAALITPSTNTRDVLTIPGVKVAKIPLLIACATDVRKNFLEASLIRNVAYNTQGPGKVTFLTAYDREGANMLDTYLTPAVVQWVKTPVLPEVLDDTPQAEDLITQEILTDAIE
ncbi:alpha-beta hydrolase superfamily lysophospholipase [Elusimicrobium simillimum]|uniref:alpha/beta hydrolase n=1 Tax=Elusimicrobium simillimum TaxID=3143438 RepID=UPI003C6F2E2D